jgi:hypothetical protein
MSLPLAPHSFTLLLHTRPSQGTSRPNLTPLKSKDSHTHPGLPLQRCRIPLKSLNPIHIDNVVLESFENLPHPKKSYCQGPSKKKVRPHGVGELVRACAATTGKKHMAVEG